MTLIKNFFWLFLTSSISFIACPAKAQTAGCTDAKAINYNSLATKNDGSCTYSSAAVTPTDVQNLAATHNESSGLILWNNKLWTHNDDTDINIYSFDPTDTKIFTAYALNGIANKDWEDIAQDENYIYVGDFGNNSTGNRQDLQIVRVSKSSLLQNNPLVENIRFSYDLQTDFTATAANKTNFDCEALVVAGDSIYLFTKEWLSKKTSIYALPKLPGTQLAKFRGSYDVQGLITGATYVNNKNLVALCGYSDMLQPFVLLLYGFEKNQFLAANKRKIALDFSFHQVEGIATTDGLHYYISNEKFAQSIINVDAKLSKLDLSAYLAHYVSLYSSQVSATQLTLKSYPNPASNFLTIALSDSNNSNIKIYNPCGQLVASQSQQGELFHFSVENMHNGLYNYVIESAQGFNYFGKFIVKN